MVELSARDKARIRAEEEARMRAEAEEAYRQQVRAELGAASAVPDAPGELPEPPAADAPLPEAPPRPSKAPSAPRPGRKPAPTRAAPTHEAPASARPRGGAAWWVAAGLTLAGGVALVAWGLLEPAAPRSDADAEADELGPPAVVAAATGPLAPAEPARWDPAGFGAERFEIGDDGVVTTVPAVPMRSFADLEAAAAADPGLRRVVLPEPPPLGALPPEPTLAAGPPGALLVGSRPAEAPSLEPLLRAVPADAWLVIGFDGPSLARSAPWRALFGALTGPDSGGPAVVNGLSSLGLLRVPEDLGAVVLAWSPAARDDPREVLVALSGAFDHGRILDAAASADPSATRTAGPPVDLVVGADGGLASAEGALFLAGPRALREALAARAGNGALLSPGLGPSLRVARDAPAGFAVLRVDDAQLEPGSPWRGLRLVVARVAVDAGLAVDLTLSASDETEARALLARLEAARGDAPPALAPVLARAVVRVEGPVVTLGLRASAEEAAALAALAFDVP